MALTPYDSPPRLKFHCRMLAPAALMFFVGFLAMGILAANPIFQAKDPGDRSPTAVLPAFEMAQTHVKTIVGHLGHLPEVCFDGNAVNDFQRRQCAEFWNRLYFGAGILAIPPIFFLLFLQLAGASLRSTYRRAQRQVAQGKAMAGGTVTSPAQAPGDLFGWAYCLRAIAVQLPNRQQIKVHIPLDAPIPMPGQTMAVFDGGHGFGRQRYFGTIYAPHVKVVAGTRR